MADAAPVIVVGGGPAGASTAWHLARLGVAVTIVDRARFPRGKVCAEYLSPQASRILTAMGAMEEIEGAGPAHLAGMRVRAPGGAELLGRFAAAHGFRGFRDRGLALPRTRLDAILLERARLAGARVVQEVRIADVERDARGRVTGVRGTTRDGAPWRASARLVIGADGLRTVIGRRTGLTRTARRPHRIAFVAHYRGLPGVTDVGEMHVEADGYVGIADIGGGIANVALVVPAKRARAAGAPRSPDAFLTAWLAGHPHLAVRFAAAERMDAVQTTGPFASAARRAWAPGVALVGDAADFFDPFTGEGVYAALRGGELLAPFAAEAARAGDDAAADRALRGYERARQGAFRGKWRVERIVGAAVAVPALMNHATRALARRGDMADLIVGVAGDFVPPREVLRAGYIARLLLFGL